MPTKPPARRLLSDADARRVAERIARKLFTSPATGEDGNQMEVRWMGGSPLVTWLPREVAALVAAELAKEQA